MGEMAPCKSPSIMWHRGVRRLFTVVSSSVFRRAAEGLVCFMARRWPQPLITWGRERVGGEVGEGAGGGRFEGVMEWMG